MNLLLRTRLHLLRSSLPLFLTTPLASSYSNCIFIDCLFLSTASTDAPPPNPHFSAVDYLIQSCNLSSQEALLASKKIGHLKSPEKPQVVLQFLRETGVGEFDMRTAVLRDSRILCSSVENNWRPNVAKLQEVGFSIKDISGLIYKHPDLFQYNIVSKVDFWMSSLGSLDNLFVILRRGRRVLDASMEKVIVPNLSFLQKQLGLDLVQIVQMIKMNLLLRTRLHLLRSSLPLFLTTPLASSYSNCIFIDRLFLSTASTDAPPPNPHFSAVDYLIQSCILSSQEALLASKKIGHLKSPEKPQVVLQFLRETGVGESDMRTAVLRDSRILCSSVENNWRPNVAKLQEVDFSIKDISGLIYKHPDLFQYNIVSKVDFWMSSLGSLDNLSVILRRGRRVLDASMEKVIVPNLSFLQKQLGLDLVQIVQMIKMAPFLITHAPEALLLKAKEAGELGVRRSSAMFVYALILVSNLNRQTIDARLNNLKSCGFSQEEATTLVCQHPNILRVPEELMGRKVDFLTKEVGCDNLDVIRNNSLLTYSLEKRLIPRNLVKKLLGSKGFPLGQKTFQYFAKDNDKQFVEKFVVPYEHAILGLQQAYADACAGKTSAKEWFKTVSI